ncbi:hypothetical protein ACHAO9_010913 [Fusarium lateritium]
MNFSAPRKALADITPPQDLQSSPRNGRPHSFSPYEGDVDYYDVRRWMFLFGYSQSEATRRIKAFRSSPPPFLVTNNHWNLVKQDMKSEGYDREAYEFFCNEKKKKRDEAKKQRQVATEASRESSGASHLLPLLEDFVRMLQEVVDLAALASAAERDTTD